MNVALTSPTRLLFTKRMAVNRQPRFAPRAAASDNEVVPSTLTPVDNTVFFGGKSFTEAEWKKAVATGVFDASRQSGSVQAAAMQEMPPSFGDIMAFTGAPEIINSRLAMLGVVAAIAAELVSGKGVLSQWTQEPTLISITVVLIIAGSLASVINKADRNQKIGPFSPQAELINGRAACLGFASLIAIEAVKGSALF